MSHASRDPAMKDSPTQTQRFPDDPSPGDPSKPIWETLHSTWAQVECLHWTEEGEDLPWTYWTQRPDRFDEPGTDATPC